MKIKTSDEFFLAFFWYIVYNKYIVPQNFEKINTKTAFFRKNYQKEGKRRQKE